MSCLALLSLGAHSIIIAGDSIYMVTYIYTNSGIVSISNDRYEMKEWNGIVPTALFRHIPPRRLWDAEFNWGSLFILWWCTFTRPRSPYDTKQLLQVPPDGVYLSHRGSRIPLVIHGSDHRLKRHVWRSIMSHHLVGRLWHRPRYKSNLIRIRWVWNHGSCS